MLFIGDIHITSRIADRVIQEIGTYIQSHPDEKSIIFLGDYVYHFSYDRAAMFRLYELFVSLYEQWKTLYILAWNHDWLADQFVFAEAQKAFAILNTKSENAIHFITKPRETEIEWQDVFFVPYAIKKEEVDKPTTVQNPKVETMQQDLQTLQTSDNTREQISAYLTGLILQAYTKNPHILVIHHCYIENTVFPWQKSRFRYKDIALHAWLLDLPDMRMISWHLHQPFVYKNYACLGSVRYTSPLESNHIKCHAQYDWQTLSLSPSLLNPYIHIAFEESTYIDQKLLSKNRESIRSAACEHIQSTATREVSLPEMTFPTWNDCSVYIQAEVMDYTILQDHIDPNLHTQLKDVKLKKKVAKIEDLLEDFDVSSRNLTTGFADRKSIVRDYIHKKYPNEAEKYLEELRNMKII